MKGYLGIQPRLKQFRNGRSRLYLQKLEAFGVGRILQAVCRRIFYNRGTFDCADLKEY